MDSLSRDIFLTAMVTATACALPGTLIVLQNRGLLADAIGHTVLLGIVIVFLLGAPLGSPFLVLGAASAGLATVYLVQLLSNHRLIAPDASIALVFPTLFALAILLINRFASNVHLDTDAVLLGMLELTPLERFRFQGWDLGPRALVLMIILLTTNTLILFTFFKEFKITTFDPALASALGISPVLLHWLLMTMVSTTAVGAFEVVGGILVVAFMVAPPATALLFVKRLSHTLFLAAAIAIFGAALGVITARWFDTNFAGTMATTQAALFFFASLIAPRHGWLPRLLRQSTMRREFLIDLLLIHLNQHAETDQKSVECTEAHLCAALGWTSGQARSTVQRALHRGLITHDQSSHHPILIPTPQGRLRAQMHNTD
jgi:manganese/zinc/iron transport system permease protein